MSLKIGDRVVYLRICNNTATVVSVYPKITLKYSTDTDEFTPYFLEDIVLEEIYNSPLYKALKEGKNEY